METYLGKNLKVKTADILYQGKMSGFDTEKGIVVLENNLNKQELKFDDILSISLAEDPEESMEAPLKESDMYLLFYEAFNIFGPFEEHFVCLVGNAVKKFIREISTANIKIIVGSDDVFGRIGFSFARSILDKAKSVSVEVRCTINDLNTMKYQNAFINSGGLLEESSGEEKSYSMIIFASNRNGNFNLDRNSSNQVIVLDIPETLQFNNFIGLGLGFIPENYMKCNRFYYIVDVGFGFPLAKKYKLPQNFKNSLMKVDVPNIN